MREGRPSQSSSLVAMVRALADGGMTTAKGFSDPTARSLLPPAWSRTLRFAEWRLERARPAARRRVAQGVDVVALRTLAIDRFATAALERGVGQVVILGAGLDGRAFRLTGVETADLFEIDHPATQAYKRAKAGSLRPRARSLRYVEVDFERDSLSQRLAEAGHDSGRPTFWIWEGVATYLSDDAMRATLGTVAARSASGSEVVITYSLPAARPFLRDVIFGRLWGEPQIGRRTPEQMASLVTGAGLVVVEDSGLSDWAEQFEGEGPAERFGMRAVLARVEG
jgi:methyltransferase (TIGR00027 family)